MDLVFSIWIFTISYLKINTGLVTASNGSKPETNKRIRCGDKLNFYTDNGKFGTDTYTIQGGLNTPDGVDDPQIRCRYSVRSSQPTYLYWLQLSKQFDGKPDNCSLQSNIIVIKLG